VEEKEGKTQENEKIRKVLRTWRNNLKKSPDYRKKKRKYKEMYKIKKREKRWKKESQKARTEEQDCRGL